MSRLSGRCRAIHVVKVVNDACAGFHCTAQPAGHMSRWDQPAEPYLCHVGCASCEYVHMDSGTLTVDRRKYEGKKTPTIRSPSKVYAGTSVPWRAWPSTIELENARHMLLTRARTLDNVLQAHLVCARSPAPYSYRAQLCFRAATVFRLVSPFRSCSC